MCSSDLLLTDGPQKWPYAFLDERQVPADFAAAMRTCEVDPGPDLAFSNMAPRPIDLGLIPEAAGDTLERIEKWPLVRTLLLWLFFAGALGAIFYATR